MAPLSLLACLGGAGLVVAVLIDTFEAIILPRTVDRPVRLTTLFQSLAWRLWRFVARALRDGRREGWLGSFGPLSLLGLIVMWAVFQIFGFGLLYWGLATPVAGKGPLSLAEYLFFSGGAFFTVGSEYTPVGALGHFLGIAEAGLGFGFLAVVISFVPTLASAFGKREVLITRFDARAGSPPAAAEVFLRFAQDDDMAALTGVLAEWEVWSAELLESYVSYPILAFYRSQHARQSWLSSITTVLDVCAVAQLGFARDHAWEGALYRQAKLTFAMARHACVDLALILDLKPLADPRERLDAAGFQRLRKAMEEAGVSLCSRPDAESDLRRLRAEYEGYVEAIGRHVLLEVPAWFKATGALDNWESQLSGAADHFTKRSEIGPRV